MALVLNGSNDTITGLQINSANIVDGSIVNADINASAAIASTKISGSFGKILQVVQTTKTNTFSGGNGGAQGAGDATNGGGTGGGLKGITSGSPTRPNTGGGGGTFGGGGGGGAGDNGGITTGGYGASGAVIIKYTI